MAAYPTAVPDVPRTLHIAPPGPRLQTDPRGDLRQFRAEERSVSTLITGSIGRRASSTSRSSEAMKKLAATGIPGFPKAEQ